MGATENRCTNMLIPLALQASIRLSRFWADKDLSFHCRFILPLLQSVIEQLHRLAGSILRTFWADRYCAAVPNSACSTCSDTPDFQHGRPPLPFEDGIYRSADERQRSAVLYC